MRYHGGKSRIAKYISKEILSRAGGAESFVSLFCGACSVEAILAPHFKNVICNDNHKYLIALMRGVQNGYELPENVTEEQYRYVKEHKDEDEILSGFVGFGTSFGGRFFEGYARTHSDNRNFAKTSKQSLLKDKENLKDVVFTCEDYRDVKLPDGCIIYADPPYHGTKQIGNKKFDSDSFWEYARKVSKTHLMFVSELSAPDDFISIWHKEITRTLDVNKKNQFKSVENLFVHNTHRSLV